MSLIATILTYKFYDKQRWWKSIKAGIFVFIAVTVLLWILKQVGLTINNLLFSLFIYGAMVYLLASGKVFEGYRTQKPIKTALVASAILIVISLVLMAGIVAMIGLNNNIILALFGG